MDKQQDVGGGSGTGAQTTKSIAVWMAGVPLGLCVGAYILVEGYRTDPADWWVIAVPGVLTGLGTLALAASTVILAYQERRRIDDRVLEAARQAAQVKRLEQAESISALVCRSEPSSSP